MFVFSPDENSENDIVITGIGMVTPLGLDTQSTWKALVSGRSAARQLSPAEVDHFEELCALLGHPPNGAPVDHAGVERMLMQVSGDFMKPDRVRPFLHDEMNRMQLLTVAEALHQAHLPLSQLQAQRTACIIGTSKPGLRSLDRWSGHEPNKSFAAAGNYLNAATPDAPLRAVQALTNTVGSRSCCPVAACATGLISVLLAAARVHSGQCDVCIAGSADAALHSAVIASFHRLGVTSRSADAATACRPFDAQRDGFVIGEGSAAFVVETRKNAARRNAPILARLRSGSWLTDTTGLTQIDTSGQCVARLLSEVLCVQANDHRTNDGAIETTNPISDDATPSIAAPGMCSLHGTATISNDLAEANGLAAVGLIDTPAFGIKAATGHLLGAAGSVELAATIMALKHQVIPPTANFTHPDQKCPVNVANHTRQTSATSALKLSLGFGGHVAGCVIDTDK